MTIFELMGMIDRLRGTAIVVTDARLDRPGPTIRYVNDAFCAMSGFPRDAAIGGDPRMLQGPGTDRRHAQEFGRVLRAGAPCRDVLLNYRMNGEPYFCAIEAHPVRDGSGGIVAFAAFEAEVERRRGRPSGEAFGRWRRLDPGVLFAGEVAPDLWPGDLPRPRDR